MKSIAVGFLWLCIAIELAGARLPAVQGREGYAAPQPLPLHKLDRDGRLDIWDLQPDSRVSVEKIEQELGLKQYRKADQIAQGISNDSVREYCKAYVDCSASYYSSRLPKRLELARSGDKNAINYCLSIAMILVDHNRPKDVDAFIPTGELAKFCAQARTGPPIDSIVAIRLCSAYLAIRLEVIRRLAEELAKRLPQFPILDSFEATRFEASETFRKTMGGPIINIPFEWMKATQLRHDVFKHFPNNGYNLYMLAYDYASLDDTENSKRFLQIYFQTFGKDEPNYPIARILAKRIKL